MLRIAHDSLLITVNIHHSSLTLFTQFDMHGGLFTQEGMEYWS